MPKLKTNRGAAKRFKVTSSGMYKHKSAYRNHILTKKSQKRKVALRGLHTVSPADHSLVAMMLRDK